MILWVSNIDVGFCFDRMMPKNDLGLGPRNDQVSWWKCVCVCGGGGGGDVSSLLTIILEYLSYVWGTGISIGPHLMMDFIFQHLARTMGWSTTPPPPKGFRGRADCGPTWYAGCGIITSTRPEILRSQTLKAYTYCVYGKPGRRLDGQTHFNCLLKLT